MARQVPRMPWHPVPRRAFCTYLQYRLLMTCSRFISFAYLTCGRLINLRLLISYVFYKESTLFFDFSFWLHQGRIPRHTCRFYCCLAAHQRTRKKDSAEPSFPILWTPPHPPGESAAAGHICCRGLCQYRIPVSGASRYSPVPNMVWVLCVRAEIVHISVDFAGLVSFVFHWWWDRLFVPAAT